MKNLIAAAVFVLALAPAYAAEDGSLWEVTSKMEMPDMPEGMGEMMGGMGMGARTVKMCRGEDPAEAVSKDKDMDGCKIQDSKNSGTTFTMKAVCKGGRSMQMEVVYNKARTEYKGTMRVKDGGEEMTMRTTGKKLGPCDATKDRAETKAKIDKMKAQGAEAQANYDAAMKKAEGDQVKGCARALVNMERQELGVFGQCYGKTDKSCKSMLADYKKTQPKAAAECSGKPEEFCARLQTPEGFYTAGGDPSRLATAAEMCDVNPDDLRPKLCKTAMKTESYQFVGAHCPADAKPLAKKHCAGRSYTVEESEPRSAGKKWHKFCVAVAARASEEDNGTAEESSAPMDEKQAKKEAGAKAKKAAKDAALGALKGFFGH